jgi:hypothetical protein
MRDENDPIIEDQICVLIDFISKRDHWIPSPYNQYRQTIYIRNNGDIDEDMLISPIQRLWIRQSIECGEYLSFSETELRAYLQQYFLGNGLWRALKHDNIRALIVYFSVLTEKAKSEKPGFDLTVVSRHYALRRTHAPRQQDRRRDVRPAGQLM